MPMTTLVCTIDKVGFQGKMTHLRKCDAQEANKNKNDGGHYHLECVIKPAHEPLVQYSIWHAVLDT
jgi:hypothetical protein